MGDELWCRQAQNGVNFDFLVKFDLEGQGQLPPKTIGTLTKVFCILGPNLAILAWKGPELSRGQASDWHTDWHTQTQTQAMTLPEDQNWPWVIKINTEITIAVLVFHLINTNPKYNHAKISQNFKHHQLKVSQHWKFYRCLETYTQKQSHSDHHYSSHLQFIQNMSERYHKILGYQACP